MRRNARHVRGRAPLPARCCGRCPDSTGPGRPQAQGGVVGVVRVVADAVGSRKAQSKRFALQRMARAGATLVTTEMVLFEWVRNATHPRFKEISALVK